MDPNKTSFNVGDLVERVYKPVTMSGPCESPVFWGGVVTQSNVITTTVKLSRTHGGGTMIIGTNEWKLITKSELNARLVEVGLTPYA